MGKTVRFNPKHAKDHVPTPQELEERNIKSSKPTKVNKGELSSKLRHGHFTKMHVWPVMNTKRKGRQKV